MKWLYKISNTVNDKLYIGVTIDPDRRWKQHKNLKNTHCLALRDAMNKYGKDKFSMEILCVGDDSIIDELEVLSIKTYNTQTPNGYNLTLGGEGTLYYEWKDEWNNLLGTMKDRDLSEKLNIPWHTIGERRRGLGIPTYLERCKGIFEDNSHLIGVLSDKELSNICGLSESWVQQERIKRGKAYRERKYYDITPDDEKYLRDIKLSQPEVTKLTGLPSGVINKWRRVNDCRYDYPNRPKKTPPNEEVLNDICNTDMSYNDIIEKHKVSKSFIATWRRKLGVKKEYTYEFTDEIDNLLMNYRDVREIVKMYNIPEKHLYDRIRFLGRKKKESKYSFLLQEPYYSRIIKWDSVCKDLALEWGIPPHSVTSVKRDYQNKNRRLHPKNLTREEWLYIRFLYESKVSYKGIIENLGLEVKRHDLIQEGLSGKRYADVTGFALNEVKNWYKEGIGK